MSHRVIRLGNAIDFVELRCLEFGKSPGMSDGDLRLGISVHDNDFSGSYDAVWIGKDDWSRFIASLSQLEREREGQASLLSMSPDEFELHLRIVGHRGGRLNADGHLSRLHFGSPSGNTMQSHVYYSIPVDPSTLRELVDLFVALGQPEV